MASAWFIILGVVVGVIAAPLANRLTSRWQRQIEFERWLRQERLHKFSDLLADLTQMVNHNWESVAWSRIVSGLEDSNGGPAVSNGTSVIEQANVVLDENRKLDAALASVLLVTDADVTKEVAQNVNEIRKLMSSDGALASSSTNGGVYVNARLSRLRVLFRDQLAVHEDSGPIRHLPSFFARDRS